MRGCSCSGIIAFIILAWVFFKFLFVPLLCLFFIIWIIKTAFSFWSNRKSNSDEYINLTFTVAGYVAAHSSSDIDLQYITIDNVIERLHLTDENVEKARRYAEQGRNFSENQIKNLIWENRALWSNKETCLFILSNQICVMFSDEILTRSEISLFASLTKWYNFSPEEGKAILKSWLDSLGYVYDKKNDCYSTRSSYQESDNSYHNGNNYQQSYSYTSESELEKAYKVLGINASTSDSEAKKAYKQKMIRYHPDRAISQGLGEEGVKRYTELSQQIQEAWNVVKKYRHIK